MRAFIPARVVFSAVLLGVVFATPAVGQTASEARVPATADQGSRPPDVFADSGNRLPLITREDLKESDRKLYDAIVGDGRLIAGLRGPAGIRLYSPRVSEYMRSASDYLRFKNGLGPRLTELVILVTSRELDQQFEWTAHETAGLKAGLEPALIDVVKYRKPLAGVAEKERAIIQLGRESIEQHKVRSDTFANALRLFGKETLVNLVCLMGQYSATAILLNTFDQQLLPGQKPLLPIP